MPLNLRIVYFYQTLQIITTLVFYGFEDTSNFLRSLQTLSPTVLPHLMQSPSLQSPHVCQHCILRTSIPLTSRDDPTLDLKALLCSASLSSYFQHCTLSSDSVCLQSPDLSSVLVAPSGNTIPSLCLHSTSQFQIFTFPSQGSRLSTTISNFNTVNINIIFNSYSISHGAFLTRISQPLCLFLYLQIKLVLRSQYILLIVWDRS